MILPAFGSRLSLRVGLLGGSFNPAHDGHRHISLLAMKRLRLDAVWWLVAPQNPLKPVEGMAPAADRLAGAKAVADHPRIVVSDVEKRLGTIYTLDTVRALRRVYPVMRFVWLMGADNMVQFPRWAGWTGIMNTLPVAVIARPSYGGHALSGRMAVRFASERLPAEDAGSLADTAPPAWVFLHGRLHHASATQIRAAAGRE
jgi:nicotinate-nucleotide adenylyltransferase